MKKNIIIAFLAFIALFAAVSCSNESSPKKDKCTVTFDLMGGSSDLIEEKVEVKYGDTVDEPLSSPKAAEDKYYVFDHWSKEGTDAKTAYDFNEKVTSDITLVAVYKARYEIGGRGPAGGFIVYRNSNYDSEDPENNWLYLEAASSDFSAVISGTNTYIFTWGNTNTAVNTETEVGKGSSNTKKMKDKSGLESSLATSVYGTTFDGYSDWFIPSKDELSAVRTAIGNKTEASFTTGYYWSSSEIGDNSAWDLYFGSTTADAEHSSSRDSQNRVRLVRVF